MHRLHHDSIVYFQFESLTPHPVAHGIFGRQGGVSQPPFDTLNVGLTVGDQPAAVAENLKRVQQAVDAEETTLVWPSQVHGATVARVSAASPPTTPPEADGLITDDPGVSLMMRFADCVPLLLYDPVHHALGMAHAGWRGTVADVAGETVRAMTAAYGTRPADLIAGIGPSISGARYEVGPEVFTAADDQFGPAIDDALLPPHGESTNPHFDLWAANRIALQRAGVRSVEVSGLCTYQNPADFFSYRRDGRRSGRFGALARLEEHPK
jgi:hypothetical protein